MTLFTHHCFSSVKSNTGNETNEHPDLVRLTKSTEGNDAEVGGDEKNGRHGKV